jgi:hypothetical protein
MRSTSRGVRWKRAEWLLLALAAAIPFGQKQDLKQEIVDANVQRDKHCKRLEGLQRSLTIVGDIENEGPVQLFAVHNDEHGLLADWIQYHARLFGISNLHVIDDNSSPRVRKMLLGFESIGMHLYNADRIIPGFIFRQAKWLAISIVMQSVRARVKGDTLLIPIDVDEFITHSKIGKQCDGSREEIRREFQAIAAKGVGKYKFSEMAQCNCVSASEQRDNHDNRRALKTTFSQPLFYGDLAKTFYLSKEFMQTDQANQHGFVESDFDLSAEQFEESFTEHYEVRALYIR